MQVALDPRLPLGRRHPCRCRAQGDRGLEFGHHRRAQGDRTRSMPVPDAAVPPRAGDHQPGIGPGRARPQRAQRRLPAARGGLGRQRDPQVRRCGRRRPARPSRTAWTSSPATAATAPSTRSPMRSWRRRSRPGASRRWGSCPAGRATGSRGRWACPAPCARPPRSCAPASKTRAVDVGRLSDLGRG